MEKGVKFPDQGLVALYEFADRDCQVVAMLALHTSVSQDRGGESQKVALLNELGKHRADDESVRCIGGKIPLIVAIKVSRSKRRQKSGEF